MERTCNGRGTPDSGHGTRDTSFRLRPHLPTFLGTTSVIRTSERAERGEAEGVELGGPQGATRRRGADRLEWRGADRAERPWQQDRRRASVGGGGKHEVEVQIFAPAPIEVQQIAA